MQTSSPRAKATSRDVAEGFEKEDVAEEPQATVSLDAWPSARSVKALKRSAETNVRLNVPGYSELINVKLSLLEMSTAEAIVFDPVGDLVVISGRDAGVSVSDFQTSGFVQLPS